MSLEEIIAGESKTIEFKEELPADSKKYMKTVVAFLILLVEKLLLEFLTKRRKLLGFQKRKYSRLWMEL